MSECLKQIQNIWVPDTEALGKTTKQFWLGLIPHHVSLYDSSCSYHVNQQSMQLRSHFARLDGDHFCYVTFFIGVFFFLLLLHLLIGSIGFLKTSGGATRTQVNWKNICFPQIGYNNKIMPHSWLLQTKNLAFLNIQISKSCGLSLHFEGDLIKSVPVTVLLLEAVH